MAKVRSLESVPFSRYLCLSNVLRICNIRAIPTYRICLNQTFVVGNYMCVDTNIFLRLCCNGFASCDAITEMAVSPGEKSIIVCAKTGMYSTDKCAH